MSPTPPKLFISILTQVLLNGTLEITDFRGISVYSTTQTLDAVYIIGGWNTKNIVAEFKNDQWRRLADLNQGRDGHGSITIGGQTMIIGGRFDRET